MKFTKLLIFIILINNLKPTLLFSNKILIVSHLDNLKLNVELSKVINSFKTIKIGDFVIKGDSTIININEDEVDLYILKNKANSTTFSLIVENTTEIFLNNEDITNTIIYKDGPNNLNLKLQAYYNSIEEEVFKPVRLLDQLIANSHDKKLVDSLSSEKKKSMTFANFYYYVHLENYISKNPNSFISLYLITRTGRENESDRFRRYFLLLSDELKKHSRGKRTFL